MRSESGVGITGTRRASAARKTLSETIEKPDEIPVIEGDDRNLPETDIECPKCGHNKAGYWMAQTRAGDEPETRFMRCTACKHRWRDAS